MPTSAPTPLLGPCGMPRATPRSARLRLAALTFTSTSLGLGRGCGTSRIASPLSLATPAFIARSPDISLALVDRNVCRLRRGRPFASLAGEEGRKVLRRADPHLRAKFSDQLLHVGRL